MLVGLALVLPRLSVVKYQSCKISVESHFFMCTTPLSAKRRKQSSGLDWCESRRHTPAFESVNPAAFADVNGSMSNNNSNAILEAPKVLINLKPCGRECFLC